MIYSFYIGLGYGAFFVILGFLLLSCWRAYKKSLTSNKA